jgi:hypothetical protein
MVRLPDASNIYIYILTWTGFVQYVDEQTARQSNLIHTNASTTGAVQWGVDSTNQTPNGRPSIRLESKKKYDTGLVVIDVAHMPFGCGTWPAFWMVGPEWPTVRRYHHHRRLLNN